MDLSSGDISHLVFRRVTRDDPGSVSLTGPMLNLLVSVDGKTSLGALADRLGLPMARVRESLIPLHQRGLVEAVSQGPAVLGAGFFTVLRAQLAVAVGPIAGVIVEDAVADLGYDPARFPAHRAAELVDLLSREIPRDDKRAAFQKSMLKKLAEAS
ncbi:MAG: hypothetical protein AB1578_08590 [Thermodesulfobacteriota bacterium]